ncbi:MAG: SPOR domain-containing protein [Ectothiorhodospiraceae bacterium]|jgi:cell division protein FtsN|nr:SPOR domain-containing protein [Ectothiorhodospiraceae bacterium]
MASRRDYKSRSAAPRRPASRKGQKRSLPGWVWLLAGLVLGLAVAGFVWLEGKRQEGERVVVTPAEPLRPQEKAPDKTQDARDVRKKPAPEPIPPAPKQRFDFYTLLPELEVVVPEPQAKPARPGAPLPPPPRVEEPGTYYLQAGSFRRFEDADRQKASLALLGIEAGIQKVTINGDTWHRIRVGPYKDLAQLNRVRERLQANQIPTLLMKVQESG